MPELIKLRHATSRRKQDLLFKNPKDAQQLSREHYYNSAAWQRLRKQYIHNHPLDEAYAEQGRPKAARHVHHLIKFEKQPTDDLRQMLLLDHENLIALAMKEHMLLHMAPERLDPQYFLTIMERRQKLYDKYTKEYGIELNVEDNEMIMRHLQR